MTTKSQRPASGEYDPYYQRYIDLVTEDDIIAALDAQVHETSALLATVSEEQAAHRYEPGKWSAKQLVGHVIDAERVFAYRALSIARGERRSLPGFDEQVFAQQSGADARPFSDLAEELAAVRRANVMMLRAVGEEAWLRVGTANDVPTGVRALAFVMLGHERHHLRVLRERYLGQPTQPRIA